MSYGLDAPVLLLNRHFQPVKVTRARRALTLLFTGAARALDTNFDAHDFDAWRVSRPAPNDELIGTISGPVRIPRLLLLTRYGRVPVTTLRLSRRNVFLRDDYTCQYCGKQAAQRELNLDHVTPRCVGGRTSWENLVTSCRRCNFRKGSMVALESAPRRFREWEPFLNGATAGAAE
jgi:hypothetical protein